MENYCGHTTVLPLLETLRRGATKVVELRRDLLEGAPAEMSDFVGTFGFWGGAGNSFFLPASWEVL